MYSSTGRKCYLHILRFVFCASVDGNLSHFQFGVFMNNAFINIFDTLVHMCRRARVDSGCLSLTEVLSHIPYVDCPHCQPIFQSHYTFTLSTAEWEGFIPLHGIIQSSCYTQIKKIGINLESCLKYLLAIE